MAYTSQFQVYSSGDSGAPQLAGTTGSLLAVFDACLVNGYGSKVGAGWTKPYANSASVYGCFKQGTGSMATLFLNDNAPIRAMEARACGWETIAGVNNVIGSGSGQFPTPAQSLTVGAVSIFKSNSSDTVQRPWVMYADSSSLYFFCNAGVGGYGYYPFFFGDVYSFKGSADVIKCWIQGRGVENDSRTWGEGINVDAFEGNYRYGVRGVVTQTSLTYGQVGMYMARGWGQTVGSINISRAWAFDRSYYYGQNSYDAGNWLLNGALQTPNAPDNSIYVDPLIAVEPTGPTFRGRMRGLWHVGHPLSNFSDGQILEGGGDYAGKKFQIVKTVGSGYGIYAIEISNTVETN